MKLILKINNISFSSEFIKPENIISTTNEILRNIKFYN